MQKLASISYPTPFVRVRGGAFIGYIDLADYNHERAGNEIIRKLASSCRSFAARTVAMLSRDSRARASCDGCKCQHTNVYRFHSSSALLPDSCKGHVCFHIDRQKCSAPSPSYMGSHFAGTCSYMNTQYRRSTLYVIPVQRIINILYIYHKITSSVSLSSPAW